MHPVYRCILLIFNLLLQCNPPFSISSTLVLRNYYDLPFGKPCTTMYVFYLTIITIFLSLHALQWCHIRPLTPLTIFLLVHPVQWCHIRPLTPLTIFLLVHPVQWCYIRSLTRLTIFLLVHPVQWCYILSLTPLTIFLLVHPAGHTRTGGECWSVYMYGENDVVYVLWAICILYGGRGIPVL